MLNIQFCISSIANSHLHQHDMWTISCNGRGVRNSKIPVLCQSEILLKGGKKQHIYIQCLGVISVTRFVSNLSQT